MNKVYNEKIKEEKKWRSLGLFICLLHTHTYTFYPRLPDTQPAKVMCSSDPDGAITVHHHCDSVFMPPSYRRDTPVMRLPLRRSPTVRSCAVLVVAIQYPPENDWVT